MSLCFLCYVKYILDRVECLNAQRMFPLVTIITKNLMWIIQGVCELREVH
jgi:hypothetical protein